MVQDTHFPLEPRQGSEPTGTGFEISISVGYSTCLQQTARRRTLCEGMGGIMNRLVFVLLLSAVVSFNAGCVGITAAGNKSTAAAPSITAQPIGQAVMAGQKPTFSVAAIGNGLLTYQWRKNPVPISGATSPAYTTPPTTDSD